MVLRTHVPEFGSFAWRLVDDRGRVVAVSAAIYADEQAARDDANLFRKQGAGISVRVGRSAGPPAFRVDGRGPTARWTFVHDDGVLARSPGQFDSVEAARVEAERISEGLRSTAPLDGPPEEFERERLEHVVIAAPLQDLMSRKALNSGHRVLIELNQLYYLGAQAHPTVRQWVSEIVEPAGDVKRRSDLGVRRVQSELNPRYVVANLTARQIQDLVRRDGEAAERNRAEGESRDLRSVGWVERPVRSVRAIYRIWPDFVVKPLLNRSARTVKADAAQAAFSAHGSGIVWAVVDSGVDGEHPHFLTHRTLDLPGGLSHRDFVDEQPEQPLVDPFGHGSHVAGTIAGETKKEEALNRIDREPNVDGTPHFVVRPAGSISGIAPLAKVLSLRVLGPDGTGHASDVIAALRYVQDLNTGGRDLKVHGVNLSVGYEFDPEWYACGHSPLCREVDLLVRTGVVVVAAAGNTGYGTAQSDARLTKAGLDVTINDPGNAERAVTVGSTHRAEPHRYGVSYFSSKGPTGDGRAKPDLVAPGEQILSCAAGKSRAKAERKLALQPGAASAETPAPVQACHYVADSGTSMAAPHVSGAIAAFLSVRPEFIGQSEEVKALFLRTATDLGRDRYFQGHGLVDLMRALQSV